MGSAFISNFAYALGANLIFVIFVIVACIVAKEKKTIGYVLYFVGLAIQALSVLGRFKSLEFVRMSYTYAVYEAMQKQVILSTAVSVIIAIVGIIVVVSTQEKAKASAPQSDAGQADQQ